MCLAIGHEDHGLAKDTIAACDALGFVPQLGKVGSLNVAVATAVAIYEAPSTGVGAAYSTVKLPLIESPPRSFGRVTV